MERHATNLFTEISSCPHCPTLIEILTLLVLPCSVVLGDTLAASRLVPRPLRSVYARPPVPLAPSFAGLSSPTLSKRAPLHSLSQPTPLLSVSQYPRRSPCRSARAAPSLAAHSAVHRLAAHAAALPCSPYPVLTVSHPAELVLALAPFSVN